MADANITEIHDVMFRTYGLLNPKVKNNRYSSGYFQ